jgi:hypothetical protein
MKRLPFPEPEPAPNFVRFEFTKGHRQELESLLSPRKAGRKLPDGAQVQIAGQIEELREAAELERYERELAKGAPTLSDEKRGLKLAAQRALDFRDVLENAPPEQMLIMDMALIAQERKPVQKEDLLSFLSDFAANIEVIVSRMPEQNRRRSNAFLIAKIARICESSGIKSSVSQTSRFFQICATLFAAIGVLGNKSKPETAVRDYCDPKGSIASYLKYAKRKSENDPVGEEVDGSNLRIGMTGLFLDSRRQSPIATWRPSNDGEAQARHPQRSQESGLVSLQKILSEYPVPDDQNPTTAPSILPK